MKNLMKVRKSGILHPAYMGVSFKPNTDVFIESRSDDSFSVHVKFLLKFEVKFGRSEH